MRVPIINGDTIDVHKLLSQVFMKESYISWPPLSTKYTEGQMYELSHAQGLTILGADNCSAIEFTCYIHDVIDDNEP